MRSRREKARRIAGILSEHVREVSTPGLGTWASAWELVAEPSDRFMDALHEWQTSGASDDLETVQEEAEALVGAWREANRRYCESLTEVPEVPA